MRNFFNTIAALSIMAVVLVSCSDDNDYGNRPYIFGYQQLDVSSTSLQDIGGLTSMSKIETYMKSKGCPFGVVDFESLDAATQAFENSTSKLIKSEIDALIDPNTQISFTYGAEGDSMIPTYSYSNR